MAQRFSLNDRTSLRDRSAILPTHSGRASPYLSQNAQVYTNRTADELESQNDEALEGLNAKVKMLKDITLGIGNEIRESTKLTESMNDAFAETSGFLAGTFRRMNSMAARQGCRWMWYIVFLILVFWFFIVVWWFRR